MRLARCAFAVLAAAAAMLAVAARAQEPAPVDFDQGAVVTRLAGRPRPAKPDPRPTFQHPPFKEGLCGMCHAPDGPPRLKAPLSGACFECHSESSSALSRKVVHSPFALGECAACHAPHESAERALLRAPAQALCLGCHKIDVNDHPVAGHPAFKPGRENPRDPGKPYDCTSCHEPHGADQPKLVRWDARGNYGSGCQTCHDVKFLELRK